MVQAAPELVEVVEAIARDPGGTITKLNQPNGFNDSTPGAPGAVPHPFASGSLLWHTKIWKDIFGGSHSHPNPAKLTQAQMNQTTAQFMGDVLALIATITDGINTAIQELSTQITTDIPDVIGLVGSDVAGLAQQINQLRAAIGSGNAAAIQEAVSQADAFTTASLRTTANVLEGRMATTDANLNKETANRIKGDESTLAKAEAFTTDALKTTAGVLEGRMAGLAATERSDVLNLNSRITGVQTVLEGDVARASQADQGYARNLVDGLNVPGLRSDVGTLQSTVAKLATETDECLTPLCDTVTPNANQLGQLGNLLKGLEGLGIAALLAGLVSAAIADPTDAATAIIDVTGWVPQLGTDLVQAVT